MRAREEGQALRAAMAGDRPVRMFPEARPWWPWNARNTLVRGRRIPRGEAMGWVMDVRHAIAERLAGVAGGAEW